MATASRPRRQAAIKGATIALLEVFMAPGTFHDAFLGPSDLALAQRILDRICTDRSIDIGSREANEVAASVIRQFQRGTRDEERLMMLYGLTARRRRRRVMAPLGIGQSPRTVR
jgi:hypothetical protein